MTWDLTGVRPMFYKGFLYIVNILIVSMEPQLDGKKVNFGEESLSPQAENLVLNTSPKTLEEALPVFVEFLKRLKSGEIDAKEFRKLKFPVNSFLEVDAFNLINESINNTSLEIREAAHLLIQFVYEKMSSECFRAYIFASVHTSGYLLIEIETSIRGSELNSNDLQNCVTWCLALQLKEPDSYSSMIIEALWRSVHYQQTGIVGNLGRLTKEKSSMSAILVNLDVLIKEKTGTDVSLVDVYNNIYKNKSYNKMIEESELENAHELNRNSFYINGNITTFSEAENLNFELDPSFIVPALDFFMKTASTTSSQKGRCITGFKRCLEKVCLPEAFMIVDVYLSSVNKFGEKLKSDFKKVLVDARDKFILTPDNIYNQILHWKNYVPKQGSFDRVIYDRILSFGDWFAIIDKFWSEDNSCICNMISKFIVSIRGNRIRNLLVNSVSSRDILDETIAYKFELCLLSSGMYFDPIVKNICNREDLESNYDAIRIALTRILVLAGYASDKITPVIGRIDAYISKKNRKLSEGEDISRINSSIGSSIVRKPVLTREQRKAYYEEMNAGGENNGEENFDVDYSQLIKARLSEDLPDDFKERAINSLVSLLANLRSGANTIMKNPSDFELSVTESFIVNCESGSVLTSFFGVTAIQFSPTANFDVELIAGEARYPGFYLANDGGVICPDAFKNHAELKNVFEVEILRLFCEKFVGEMDGADLNTILILLGLKEYVPSVSDMEIESEGFSDAAESESDSDNLELDKAAAFIKENADRYNRFSEMVQSSDGFEISGDWSKDLYPQLVNLKSSFVNCKTLAPDNGVAVNPPEGHPMAHYVDQILFYNISRTESILAELGINTSYFGENVSDAYLCRVSVKMEDGSNEFLNAFVVPPSHDVHIVGISTESMEADKDKFHLSLSHLIVESLSMAVSRDYDIDSTRATSNVNGGDGGWNEKLREAIDFTTEAGFPFMVFSGSSQSDSNSNSEVVGHVGNVVAPAYPERRAAVHEEVFGDPDSLLARGVFIDVKDALRFDGFPDPHLPGEAWANRNGSRCVKGRYGEVHVPVREKEELEKIFEIMRDGRMIESVDLETEVECFNELLNEGGFAAQVFADMIEGSELDTTFVAKCKNRYEGNPNENYKALFGEILEENFELNPLDLFKAFMALRPINPAKLRIPVDLAANYRLPFRFSEVPEEGCDSIFEADGVLAVIEGNRARISETSELFIKGHKRSSEMTYAAKIQSEFREEKSGSQINLDIRTRALLVFAFADGAAAFRYLSSVQSVDNEGNNGVSSVDVLKAQSDVRTAIASCLNENGEHSDFSDLRGWSVVELERLVKEGVIRLEENENTGETEIVLLKEIDSKKVVIFTEEDVGYRQFQNKPTNYAEHLAYVYNECEGSDLLPEGFEDCDPETLRIHSLIYDKLGI